jgi:hypothetical protein
VRRPEITVALPNTIVCGFREGFACPGPRLMARFMVGAGYGRQGDRYGYEYGETGCVAKQDGSSIGVY